MGFKDSIIQTSEIITRLPKLIRDNPRSIQPNEIEFIENLWLENRNKMVGIVYGVSTVDEYCKIASVLKNNHNTVATLWAVRCASASVITPDTLATSDRILKIANLQKLAVCRLPCSDVCLSNLSIGETRNVLLTLCRRWRDLTSDSTTEASMLVEALSRRYGFFVRSGTEIPDCLDWSVKSNTEMFVITPSAMIEIETRFWCLYRSLSTACDIRSMAVDAPIPTVEGVRILFKAINELVKSDAIEVILSRFLQFKTSYDVGVCDREMLMVRGFREWCEINNREVNERERYLLFYEAMVRSHEPPERTILEPSMIGEALRIITMAQYLLQLDGFDMISLRKHRDTLTCVCWDHETERQWPITSYGIPVIMRHFGGYYIVLNGQVERVRPLSSVDASYVFMDAAKAATAAAAAKAKKALSEETQTVDGPRHATTTADISSLDNSSKQKIIVRPTPTAEELTTTSLVFCAFLRWVSACNSISKTYVVNIPNSLDTYKNHHGGKWLCNLHI